MKRSTIIMFLAVLCGSVAVRAAEPQFSGLDVSRDADDAKVSFQLTVPRDVVRSEYAMALQPVITDGTYSVSLRPVVIRGRRAETLDTRYRRASGLTVGNDVEPIRVHPGVTMDYSDAVPFQPWMDGAELRMESLTWGCCDIEAATRTLASDLLPAAPEPVEPVEQPVPPAPETTGDVLSRTFPFVVSEDDYVPGEPVFDDDRENAVTLYYRQNSSLIEPDYSTNRLMLTNISAAIQTIAASPDSEVSRVVVAGFSSPEGNYSRNDVLAWERAVSVKEYIMNENAIPESDITIHNGSEDWQGLRLMVEGSDMPESEKRQVLDIIRTAPVLAADGIGRPRREQLQRLNGGATYRYMYEHFFPMLRSGAFIRVYYRNTDNRQ